MSTNKDIEMQVRGALVVFATLYLRGKRLRNQDIDGF